ncbi:MAG TPA: N-acetylmuramoyl-L-alanine amidase [Actinoplanes sp.]|nr:N-acetylmuramoyl-L-alanine amidase [Actinoplanes sp.]
MNLVPRSTAVVAAATGTLLVLTAAGVPATGPAGAVPAAGPAGTVSAAATEAGPGPEPEGEPEPTGEPEPSPDPIRPGPAWQAILSPVAGPSPTGRSLGVPGSTGADAAAGAWAVPQRRTRPFSLIGATWTDPTARLNGTVEVRTRALATGRWTGWQALDSDGASPADPAGVDGAGRGRTDPLWVGTSDGVQARVAADGGRATPLPDGLRLDLINPDAPVTAADPAPTARTEPAPTPGAATTPTGRAETAPTAGTAMAPTARAGAARPARVPVPARPVPRVVTRSGWGANESLVKNEPDYTTDVQVVFVHHTAGTNNYSCRDSARIIRGIQGYHVRGNGWNDIGYNFLVDRCGTLFEGRKGGVARPVLGAHTLGFNAHSSAIAVLGDYRARGVPARVRTAIAQVAAYKLGMYGHLATAHTMLRSSGSDRYPEGRLASLYRISGHRDTGRTACPGNALYSQLGAIRSTAGAGPAGLRLLRMYGATAVGSAYYTRGLISPLWTTSTPSTLLNRFDVYVDGTLVVSARNTHRRGTLRLAPGRHTVTVRAVHLSGRTAGLSYTVVVDDTAPAFTMGPAVVLRPGPLHGAVPVRVGWRATDNVGLRSMALTRPRAVTLSPAATGWPGYVRPAVPTTWTLRAADRAGNTRSASVTRTAEVVADTAATRTGRWTKLRNSAYLSGTAMHSTTRGSSMSWTFTGRSAGLAVSRTRTSGTVTVYLDGQRVAALNLRSTSTLHRRAVWARNWGISGQHTIRVVVGGPAVLDGLVVLR